MSDPEMVTSVPMVTSLLVVRDPVMAKISPSNVKFPSAFIPRPPVPVMRRLSSLFVNLKTEATDCKGGSAMLPESPIVFL